MYISHDILANEADDVKLFCNSTGNPRPNITWTFLNGSNSRIIRTGETLILSNVTRNQAGTYKCTAANGIMVPNTANVQVAINCKYDIFDYFIFLEDTLACSTCTFRTHLWDVGLSTIGKLRQWQNHEIKSTYGIAQNKSLRKASSDFSQN